MLMPFRLRKITEGIPTVTAQEMKDLDDELVNAFGIDLLLMMENAGKSLALLAREMLGNVSTARRRIVCLIGKGNNGGGALVAARRLHNWGANVECILALPPEKMRDVPVKQFHILQRMGVISRVWDEESTIDFHAKYELIIDGLIGYNLRGNPEPPFGKIISAANESGVPILALDLPSGLDATTGRAFDPCIIAKSTLTLMLPKSGLKTRDAERFVGDLYLADISAPLVLYRKLGIADSLFSSDTIVRLG
jgi:NAD(P)H-hydrate epimerase